MDSEDEPNQEELPSIDYENSALIPGLPNDIALSCLSKVPRKHHPVLNCVSKVWRDLLCSDEWLSYRRTHNLEESWIYALCRDKSDQLCLYVLDPDQLKRGWKRVHGLPVQCSKRKGVGFEVLGKKLYLFGGCGWIEDASDEVYCYDASVNTWTRAGSLSTARCFFAHEALDDKIYAIGGLVSKSSNPHSFDIYDSRTNCWSSFIDPDLIPDIEDSMVLDGKIYLRCGNSLLTSHLCALVYDPSVGSWQQADADVISRWRGPTVVMDRDLFVLDQTSGVRLMTWRMDVGEWTAARRLSTHLVNPPCRLVAVGKKIFVIGKGLSTVVFDIENAGSGDGVLVGSSVVKLSCEDDVVSCKALAI